MDDVANISNAWIAWNAAALVASLVHVFIDFHVGLYGETSSQMSPLQAANLSLTSLVYGWWLWSVVIAVSGDRFTLVSALVVAVMWSFLWNGVIGLVVSSPPSSVFPYQDLAHLSSIVFGAGASVAVWRAIRSVESEVSWTMPIVTCVIPILAFVVQSVLGLQNAR